MAGYNHCVFVGRVGIEPELRETNEGVSYCRFRLAVDQGKEEPMWLSVVAWRHVATQVEKYVKKGSLVLVSGRLSVDTYTDKENQKQTGVEIVAWDVHFLDQKPKTGTEMQVEQQSSVAADGQGRQPKRLRLYGSGAGREDESVFSPLGALYLLSVAFSNRSARAQNGRKREFLQEMNRFIQL